jgi:hypothetical protein
MDSMVSMNEKDDRKGHSAVKRYRVHATRSALEGPVIAYRGNVLKYRHVRRVRCRRRS